MWCGKRTTHAVRAVAFLSLGLTLGGCGTVQRWSDTDPLEPFNREMFAINQSLDKHAALPAAEFYRSAVPGGLRNGFHNVLSNIGLPVSVANAILQGEFKRAGESAERFCVNTTWGVLG